MVKKKRKKEKERLVNLEDEICEPIFLVSNF
jgi:hypothetical protein